MVNKQTNNYEMCVCVCVCVKERETDRELVSMDWWVGLKAYQHNWPLVSV